MSNRNVVLDLEDLEIRSYESGWELIHRKPTESQGKKVCGRDVKSEYVEKMTYYGTLEQALIKALDFRLRVSSIQAVDDILDIVASFRDTVAQIKVN